MRRDKKLASLMVLTFAVGSPAWAQQLPDLIMRGPIGIPEVDRKPIALWMSAEYFRGLDDAGRRELTPDWLLATLEEAIASPSGRLGCAEMGEYYGGPHPDVDRSTLRMQVETAALVVAGRVRKEHPGIFQTVIGRMLEIEPQEVFVGDVGSAVWVFVPTADVELLGARVCKTDRRYTAVGEGDEVVIMPRKMIKADGIDLGMLEHSGSLVVLTDAGPRFGMSLEEPEVASPTAEDFLASIRRLSEARGLRR